jgi:hypothetical protein
MVNFLEYNKKMIFALKFFPKFFISPMPVSEIFGKNRNRYLLLSRKIKLIIHTENHFNRFRNDLLVPA